MKGNGIMYGFTRKTGGFYHVHCRSSHTFPLLYGYQQVPHTGIPGSVGQKKGIHILGTGDFTHPLWRQELKEKLESAEPGLYKLKPELRLSEIPSGSFDPRFVVSGEISTIYKKNGRTRKVHSLILLPGLEAADRLSGELEKLEIFILTDALF